MRRGDDACLEHRRLGDLLQSGLETSRISAATVNITIWMIGVTPIGSVVPSAAAMCGRRSGNKPKMTIVSTPSRKM